MLKRNKKNYYRLEGIKDFRFFTLFDIYILLVKAIHKSLTA
jgi:hypothetical protein